MDEPVRRVCFDLPEQCDRYQLPEPETANVNKKGVIKPVEPIFLSGYIWSSE